MGRPATRVGIRRMRLQAEIPPGTKGYFARCDQLRRSTRRSAVDYYGIEIGVPLLGETIPTSSRCLPAEIQNNNNAVCAQAYRRRLAGACR